MIKRLNEEKGFTLVELLIVIAILGILAVAAAPRFIAYKLQADANTCLNNQSTIETAVEQVMATGAYTAYNATILTQLATGATVGGVTFQAPLKVAPTCPGKGTYALNTTTGIISCNFKVADTSDPDHVR